MSLDKLAAIGVTERTMYWEAEQKLAREGYQCFVAGARREAFDCTKSTGVLPSCLMRITFVADDANRVSRLKVADPACMGTP